MDICNKMFEELAGRDIDIIINCTDSKRFNNKKIKLAFFEKEVVVDLDKKEIYCSKDKKEPLDTFSSSLVLHYLLNAKGTHLAASWISYRELPGGLFYWQKIPEILGPLISKYENNGERFLKKTFEIGGEKYASFKHSSIIHPFKMFPVLMIFDEKSSEFEANIRVLFDGSAADYLKTDVIKLILTYIVKELCK